MISTRTDTGRRVLLSRLARRYAEDARLAHLRVGASRVVPGSGAIRPKCIFVGEAPGAREDKLGRPFCGPSGAFLDELLASINLDRGKVYITNVVKFRPPANRDPTDDEMHTSYPYLRREMQILGLPPVVALGRHARGTLTGALKGHPVGRWTWMHVDGVRVPLLPLHHPAFGIYQRANRPMMFEHFKAILEEVSWYEAK